MRKLEDVCTLITDGTHYSPKDDGDGLPFVTVKDMSDLGLDFDNCIRISEEVWQVANKGNSAPKSGDVLLSKDGTVGKVHVVKNEGKFAALSSIAIIRPNPEILDSDYLGHFLKSEDAMRQASRMKTGTALKRIILKDIKRIKLRILSLEEQRRISAILDKADEIKEKTEKSNEIRVELKNSIFFDLFGDLSINPHNFPEYDLSEIADFQEGPGILAVDFHDEGIPLLRLKGIGNEFATLDGCNYLLPERVELKWKHFCVQKGDILIGSSASVGRVSIVDDNTIGAIPYTGIIRFRINEKLVNQTFLLALLRSDVFIRQVTRMSTGSTIKHFGPTHLKKVRLPVPPLNLQNELDKLFSSLRGIETTDILAKNNSKSITQELLT